MHPLDDTAKLLDKSLSKIKNKIRIERAYLDRWFDKPKYIRVLNKHAIKFIMPMTRLKTVKSHMDKAVNCDARTFNKFKIGKGDNQVKVNLILVNNKSGDKKAFISNFEINPTIAHYCFKLYGRRWGIETGYRVIEDIKPKTTSKNYYLRLFYFMFSCCLHNLWVLMNICVSLSIHGEIKPKPILTMLEFTVILIKIRREIT
jgi:putative transposase